MFFPGLLSRRRRPTVKGSLYILCCLLAVNVFFYIVKPLTHEENKTKVSASELGNPQLHLDYIASYLDIKYAVLENHGKNFNFRITLLNVGPVPIQNIGWAVYFHHFFLIADLSPDSILVCDGEIKVIHINGDLYRLEPTNTFQQLGAGHVLKIDLRSFGASIAISDVPPNWYVALPSGYAKVLRSTEGEGMEFVKPFDQPKKWKKHPKYAYKPFTAEERFVYNNYTDMGFAPLPVLPQPLVIRTFRGKVVISSSWKIVSSTKCPKEATFLADKINLKVLKSGAEIKRRIIHLKLGSVVIPPNSVNTRSTDRYNLTVRASSEVITLTGGSCRGLYFAIQTLLSLRAQDGSVPETEVVDAPRFAYRGFMLDVARNFFPKEQLMELIEVMGMYKMNKLHLHLSDDQAWRLDIPGLPELVKVGSRRGHTLDEADLLMPQLGSGPFPLPPGSGHYTQDDYRQILRYAARHHIDVIPELDFPGHARAAIKAMISRHRKENTKEFLLSDPKDKSQYKSVQHFTDNVINPCLNSTSHFLNVVVAALKGLHHSVAPLTTLHIGGDEIPLGALKRSPACGATGRRNASDRRAVRSFQKNFINIVNLAGLSVQAWDDAFFNSNGSPLNQSLFFDTKTPHSTLSVHTRHSGWGGGRAHRPIILANNGYKVIHSAATYLFLDHAQEPDPAERGQHWATRYVDTRRVFSFAPLTYLNDVDVDHAGNPITLEEACGVTGKWCPPLQKPKNIIGLQAHMWTEMVRTRSQLHQMVFPRLLAAAERSWHSAPWEELSNGRGRRGRERDADWTKFVNTLGYRELGRLEEMGIEFYLPPPGAVKKAGHVSMNSPIPGLPIEFSTDGGTTWKKGKKAPDVKILHIRTRSYTSSRTSRVIAV